jgi:hypothetical protein
MADTPYTEALKTRVAAKLDALHAENTTELETLKIGRFAEPRRVLHHYTTADGLLGILAKKVIYATGAPFMNDYSEVLYGITMAKNFAMAEIKKTNQLFEYNLLHMLSGLLDNIEQSHAELEIYITCFCEKRDLLSQWRGYGANGGYSLDPRPDESFQLTAPTHQHFVKILYDRELQEKLVNSYILRHAAAFREAFELDKGFSLALRLDGTPHPAVVEMNRIVTALVGDLLNLAFFFKSPTFEEESEWRLLTHRTPDSTEPLKFRSARGLICPYLEIPIHLTPSSLDSITCGPSPHGTLTKKAVKSLLGQNGLPSVSLLGSEIPLKVH